ncbi:M23 family metallopeptidase [Paracoccus zeaxanthinifaciens]|uniref:M23 family metallopeptidase n=1 Tax=Paracoccus zeaxanthinifaciens TaxID=187400 RepID=UPI0003B53803|nr:M23 family metallopeptidase [Paracoccus zeaxanthinifaciens]
MGKTGLKGGIAIVALTALGACAGGNFDPDLRGIIGQGGLDTSGAAAQAAARPAPDSRGVITFQNGQVALANGGDTPASVAARLGIDATTLARHNALAVDAPLNAGAVLVLPGTVPTSAPASGGATAVTDPFAKATGSAPRETDTAPRNHVVVRGETAWSIARKYGISVQDLASWNGLPADMALHPGQRLIVPKPGEKAPAATDTKPGQGTPTPVPPSAAAPLPDEETAPASEPAPDAPDVDLGADRTAASGGRRFAMPVSGSIIRDYEKGKNDGIDIAAPSGAAVNAAGSGTVAAITRDTAGTPIVVVRHDNDLMTVYAGLGDVSVAKGDSVSAGQGIGKAGDGGSVHFEVRRGFDSRDPTDYLN